MPRAGTSSKGDEKNLYQRNGVWWLKAYIDNVEYRESLRTNNLRDARQRRDKRIKALQDAARFNIHQHTWDEAVASWWAHAKADLSPQTAKRYGVSFKQCLPFLQGKDIEAIDGSTISAIMASRRAAGVKPATIRRDLTAISRVLEFAEGEGWREGNPTLSKRRTIKERRDPIVLPKPDEVEEMIEACSSHFASLVRGAWYTGCRQGELVNAKWRDFNEAAGTLEVTGKGNKRRVFTLSDRALELFKSQKAKRLSATHPIFPAESGEAFAEAASDYTHFRRRKLLDAEKAGQSFRRFRFHDLRHLFAVEYLRGERASIYRLSKTLGHTSVKTTEIYLEFLTPEEAERVKE